MIPKLVLCEGKDDQAVIEGLLGHLGIEAQVSVEAIRGRDKLGAYLRALSQRSDFARQEVESLGIILDADNDPEGGWRRIVDQVESVFKVSLPAPDTKVGTRPGIIATLVPAGRRTGMLESVCLESVSTQPEHRCFEEYVECVKRVTSREWHPKARFRAWMASQADYDFLVERAARENLLPWEHEAFESLRQFLGQL
jgi:hypothetical protein